MVAKGGARAAGRAEAVALLKRRLLPLATLLTPNLPEAEMLAGMAIAGRGCDARAPPRRC